MDAPATPRDLATLRGLRWTARALLGFLGLLVVTAAVLVLFIPAYSLLDPDPAQLAAAEESLLLVSWGLVVAGILVGLAYLTGLAGLHTGRLPHGPAHARSVEQTLPLLAVTMLLLAAGVPIPSLAGPFLGIPGLGTGLPSWAPPLDVVLSGLQALFAGLTLFYGVQGLSLEGEKVQLLIAVTLGVVGALAWSGFLTYAAQLGPLSSSLPAFVAGILGGLGTSVISLAVFASVHRQIQRRMAGGPADPR